MVANSAGVISAASSSAIRRASAGANPGRDAERRSRPGSAESIAARTSAWRCEVVSSGAGAGARVEAISPASASKVAIEPPEAWSAVALPRARVRTR